jgi:hypothetical protein
MLVGAGPGHSAVHDAAWAISKTSTRRFFVLLAVAAFVVIVAASALAAFAAARNAAVTDKARDRGLRVAESVTRFRIHLSLADAEVATVLVTERDETPFNRARYEAELLDASLSLTDAGLAATGRNADDIGTLAAGLVRYAGLVETSRQYPIGTTFHDLARDELREVLVPTADRVRRAAEGQVEAAAGDRTTRWAVVAIGGLVLALVVLVAVVVLVAGRVVELTLVGPGLWSQRNRLEAAGDAEIAAFTAANAAATDLFDLRTVQTTAVAARGGGDADFERFDAAAGALADHLAASGARTAGLRTLGPAVAAYVDSAGEVAGLAAQDRDREAVAATVDGSSAIAYRTARRLAVSTVNRSTRDLGVRLDAAADDGVAWPVPLGFGTAVAVLAAGGVLRRGWDYL